ncbi:MAG: GspH/FimT family pseudopilin [Pseudomonadota bacterium]|nr:GspH/FimT family pseudopilin [Pseudomonadota bacterium]
MNTVRDTTHCKNTRRQPLRGKIITRGFTLLEILVAVTVVSILLAIALPSYSAALGRADCNTLLTALMGSITDARGAAQNYESDAILCPSDDGASCSGKAQWQNGWIVGVDGNGDNSISGGESVISRQPGFEENVHMVTSSGRTRLQFQPYGSNAGSNVTFTLCDRRGESGSSAYVLNNSGHFHEARPTAQNTAAACAGM